MNRAILLAVAVLAASASGQDETRRPLLREARAITDAAAAEIASRETWEPLRAQRLEEMRDMLGLLPWPERTPLRVRNAGRLERPGYTVEKLAFESLPHIYVTANLYLPRGAGAGARVPAIVYVCGHSYSPHGAKAQYQRHGISFAKNGYACIILDPIQIAETFALHHGILNQAMPEWYARGYSPAGVEVWNAMRAIDYLETRPEVDAAKVGMTGRSGGAAMTWFTAAVDPRVKVAAPVMGISTYAANLEANTQRLHCDCMFVVNSRRHCMLHQGALIAPRPLLMAHGSKDALFPVPGYEEFERRIAALYGSYGRAGDFRNIVVDTAHQDSDFLREQAIRWFDKYLRGGAERELDMTYTNEPGETLVAFPGGPPADAENHRVHETFLPTPAFRRYRRLPDWEKRRAGLMRALRERVFAAMWAEGPLDIREGAREGDSYFRELRFVSEPGVEIQALVNRPKEARASLPALLYVASEGDDADYLQRLFRQARPEPRVIRMAVFPRGTGEKPWPRGLWLDMYRNAMHTGQTVDSLRLRDVLRALAVLRTDQGVDPARITLAGSGASGILALYAAILEPQVHQALLMRPPSSHTEGPYFLDILRHADIPEAAALLAPRRLNFYSHMPTAFEPTREIYRLYGQPDHVFVTMEMANVLEGRYGHAFSSGL